jgi:hypothetical protein
MNMPWHYDDLLLAVLPLWWDETDKCICLSCFSCLSSAQEKVVACVMKAFAAAWNGSHPWTKGSLSWLSDCPLLIWNSDAWDKKSVITVSLWVTDNFHVLHSMDILTSSQYVNYQHLVVSQWAACLSSLLTTFSLAETKMFNVNCWINLSFIYW